MDEMFCFIPILFEITVICKRLFLVIRNNAMGAEVAGDLHYPTLYLQPSIQINKKKKIENQYKSKQPPTKLKSQKRKSSLHDSCNEVTFCMDLPNGL